MRKSTGESGAPTSREEPAPARRRAGIMKMAWRSGLRRGGGVPRHVTHAPRATKSIISFLQFKAIISMFGAPFSRDVARRMCATTLAASV